MYALESRVIRFELSTFCAQICISEPPGLPVMPGSVVGYEYHTRVLELSPYRNSMASVHMCINDSAGQAEGV